MRHDGRDIRKMKANKNSKRNSGSKTVSANATAKAVNLTLDKKNSNSARVTKALLGVDLFALHSAKQYSEGYCAAVTQYGAKASAKVTGNSWLLFDGISNRIDSREGGFYARTHSGGGKSWTVFGNSDLLASLYGGAVAVLSDSEIRTLFDKGENVTVRVGSRGDGSLRELTGRIVAEKGNCFSLAVEQTNGSLALHNGEWRANVYNAGVRALKLKG